MKYNGWFALRVVLQSSLWSLFTSSPTPFDAYNADHKSSQYNVYRLSYRRSSRNLEEAKKLKLYWKYHLLASCSGCSLAYRFSYSALRGRWNKDSRMSTTFLRRLCKSFYLTLSDLSYSVLISLSKLPHSTPLLSESSERFDNFSLCLRQTAEMTVRLQVYTTTANNNKCPSSFHDG